MTYKKRDSRLSIPVTDDAKKYIDKILHDEKMTLSVFLRTAINYYVTNALNKKPVEFSYRKWRKRS